METAKLTQTLAGMGFKVTPAGGSLNLAYDLVSYGKFTVPANSPEVAILALARVCNYASTWDGCGFSKSDADFGHSLAKSVERYGTLTDKQRAAVQRNKGAGATKSGLIEKYRKQLIEFGFDMETLLGAAPEPKGAKVAQVELEIEVRGFVKKETDKAILVEAAVVCGGGEHWLPKSQVKITGERAAHTIFLVPAWLCEKKGLSMWVGVDAGDTLEDEDAATT